MQCVFLTCIPAIRCIQYVVLIISCTFFFKSKPSYSCQYASLTLLMLYLFLYNADRIFLESWANRRKDFGFTIDRTIGRRRQRLIVRSVARCYDRSCYRSLHPTIDRTTSLRVPRLIVGSVTGCHACSYDRSQDAMIDLPYRAVSLVAGRHD